VVCSVETRDAASRDAGIGHLAGLGLMSITTSRSHGVIVLRNIYVNSRALEWIRTADPPLRVELQSTE